MVNIDLTIVLTVILCIVIFLSSNLGLYIIFRGNNPNIINYRSSFVVFLGYYYALNYIRLLYMILSFFVYNSDLAQWYIIYTQCIYIIQPAYLLFMSLSRFMTICKTGFSFSSLAFTNILALLMIFVIGLYALAVYVFKVTVLTQWVGVAVLVVNIASAVFSLFAILSVCCVRNEKRRQIKMAFISFFMASIYLVQFGVAYFLANNARSYYYYGNNYSYSTYSINGYVYYNSNIYNLINSMGYLSISTEIVILLGSSILYFLFRPSTQTNRPQLSTTVIQGATPNAAGTLAPVGPLMT